VWDFPRPPELVHDVREIVVLWGKLEVARTRAAWVVRETAHPPTFYLPLADVRRASGKVQRTIGIWSTMGVGWHRSLGAIRSLWQGQSRWLNASPFTRTISIAAWAAPGLLHSLALSMVGGSRQS
jgi:hypothetical protein